MRAVVQRVKGASVEVDNKIVSKIGPGLLCLIGIKDSDTAKDAQYICNKILKCRAFQNPETGRAWDLNVMGIKGSVLLVSQFTLYGRFKKAKPDYSKAMPPLQAKEFYEQFVAQVQNEYVPELVQDGVFGAYMNVSLVNDGPVTYFLDSEFPDR